MHARLNRSGPGTGSADTVASADEAVATAIASADEAVATEVSTGRRGTISAGFATASATAGVAVFFFEEELSPTRNKPPYATAIPRKHTANTPAAFFAAPERFSTDRITFTLSFLQHNDTGTGRGIFCPYDRSRIISSRVRLYLLGFPVFLDAVREINDHIHCAFNTDSAGIDAEIIALGISPALV